ncbi:hypothetical protein B1400_1519 [Bifidobacterium italicum]|uniref:Uncharacterized protein n=1 Tax=Bifidobacterium italicum TaxID=1960968 RepID=A0A2A2EFX5_9BIFI|nr:hypothetical protein [Bifidobacterium italicum]PAU67836.1 hypothetical protein B1400_1519 [Bifidobacterium italicum]
MLEDSITRENRQKNDPVLVKHECLSYIDSSIVLNTIASSEEWVCDEHVDSDFHYSSLRKYSSLRLRVAESNRTYYFSFSDKTFTASIGRQPYGLADEAKKAVPKEDINRINQLFSDIEKCYRQQVMSVGAADGAKKTMWWSIGFFLFALFCNKTCNRPPFYVSMIFAVISGIACVSSFSNTMDHNESKAWMPATASVICIIAFLMMILAPTHY